MGKSSQTLVSQCGDMFKGESDTNLRNSRPLLEVGVQVLVARLSVRKLFRVERARHMARRKNGEVE